MSLASTGYGLYCCIAIDDQALFVRVLSVWLLGIPIEPDYVRHAPEGIGVRLLVQLRAICHIFIYGS